MTYWSLKKKVPKCPIPFVERPSSYLPVQDTILDTREEMEVSEPCLRDLKVRGKADRTGYAI